MRVTIFILNMIFKCREYVAAGGSSMPVSKDLGVT